MLPGDLFRGAPGQRVDHLFQLVGAQRATDQSAKRTGAASGRQRGLRPRLLDLGQQRLHLGAGGANVGAAAGGAEVAARQAQRAGVDRVDPVRVRGGDAEGDLGRAAADITDGRQGEWSVGGGDGAHVGQPALALGREHAGGDSHRITEGGQQGWGVRTLATGRGHHHLQPVAAHPPRQVRVPAGAVGGLGQLCAGDPAAALDHVAQTDLAPLLAQRRHRARAPRLGGEQAHGVRSHVDDADFHSIECREWLGRRGLQTVNCW